MVRFRGLKGFYNKHTGLRALGLSLSSMKKTNWS